MAAPAIRPIRLGTVLAVGKSTGVDADQPVAFLTPAAGHRGRIFVSENFFYRNDIRYTRPVLGASPVPPRWPRGSTGMFDGLPGQRISSSAFFAA